MSNAMFLIRFINKFFIQNLDEKDIEITFERSDITTVAEPVNSHPHVPTGLSNGTNAPTVLAATHGPALTNGTGSVAPVNGFGVANGVKSVGPQSPQSAIIANGEHGSTSTLVSYTTALVDLLIKSSSRYFEIKVHPLADPGSLLCVLLETFFFAATHTTCTKWKPLIH